MSEIQTLKNQIRSLNELVNKLIKYIKDLETKVDSITSNTKRRL